MTPARSLRLAAAIGVLGLALGPIASVAQETARQVSETPRAAPVCDPGTVILHGSAGPVSFAVELALTPEDQARGLMFRPALAPEAGMLFVYETPRPAMFWMKNTMIPLDMLFLDDAGQVTNIAARTIPYSLEGRASTGPVRAVLEINGGLAEELGIGPGAQAVHPAFAEAPEGYRCAVP